jgi:hypothetical protein
MAKVASLSSVDSLQNETSALQIINTNTDNIEVAFQNTLSRDGSTPNSMSANLDLGSFRIINLGAPVNSTDAVRKIDLDGATGNIDDATLALLVAAPTNAANAAASAASAAASAVLASQYIGAATSADKWVSARTITLSGVLSGSQSFDGSANFTVTASLVDGSITSAKLASGVALSNLGYTPVNKTGDTLTGDLILLNNPGSLSQYSAGFRGIPVTTQDTNYTFILSDSGKMTRHTSGTGHSYTIPPNSSVNYPVGTVLLARNVGTGVITLTRGSGVTLRLAGSSSSGDKSLAQWGLATLIQEATDTWVVSGPGVS